MASASVGFDSVKEQYITNVLSTGEVKVNGQASDFKTKYSVDGYHYFPKDTGWSWAVLVASFLLQTIAIGICVASGVFLVEFMEEFDTSRSDTAWISSIEIGLAYILGAPTSGVISIRVSHRTSIIVGGLIMSIGLFASSFANGIFFLYISCGLVTGFGVGLVYSPSIGVIGVYFQSRLPLALGIVTAGGGAGAMVFSFAFRLLIAQYGWRGSLLVVSAIVLNCCSIGAVIFPASFWKHKKSMTFLSQEEQYKEDGFQKADDFDGIKKPEIHTPAEKLSGIENEAHSKPALNGFKDLIQDGQRHESVCHNGRMQQAEQPLVNAGKQGSENGERYTESLSKNISRDIEESESRTRCDQQQGCCCSGLVVARKEERPLVTDPRFILIFINTFLVCFGTFAVFILLIDYVETCGAGIGRDSAALLLSLTGLMSTVGRFSTALLMTFLRSQNIDVLNLYLATIVISGVSVVLMPVTGETFGVLMVLCSAFGFSYGGNCSAAPVMVSEVFGADRLTTIFSYILIAAGSGCLLGSPFTGWVYEISRSYRLSFLLNGLVTLLSFLFLVPLSCNIFRRTCLPHSTNSVVMETVVIAAEKA